MADNLEYIKERLRIHLDQAEVGRYLRIIDEDIAQLSHMTQEDVDAMIHQLISGHPIQYVTGIAPFYGYFFAVDDRVLIPRPETEELVYLILADMNTSGIEMAKVLDIGTGSGCIPISIKKEKPDAGVYGVDVSAAALAVAEANADRHQVSVSFAQIDILDEVSCSPLDGHRFDVIVSNPPYIPHREKALMSSNVLDHEPHLALFVDDEDPLLFYRRIVDFADSHLALGGAVYFEVNEFNAAEVVQLFGPAYATQIFQDMQGKDRIVRGRQDVVILS